MTAPLRAVAVHQPGRERGAAPRRAHGFGDGTVAASFASFASNWATVM
ncbi:hypothetical protein ACWD4G_44290 [Streptomyces sp. NPDC002643]